MTLSPAYGRDYHSIAAVMIDWHAGKDFIIEGRHPDAGKPTNKFDMKVMGETGAMVRYANLRRQVAVKT